MKNTYKFNLVNFLSAFYFSSTLLTVSALTNSSDVDALDLLKATFLLSGTISGISVGDPCLPEPYSWVQCSSHVTPRIIALNLNGSYMFTDGRTRVLPDFSDMDALEIIDISNNYLKEDFPDFLANFPKLKVLNLANNFFTGTVPISLRDRYEAKTLNLTLTGSGMTRLCYSDEDSCGTKNRTLPIALGIGIPVFVILCAILVCMGCQKKGATEASAAGQTHEIYGLAIPVYADNAQQMHPTVRAT